MQEKGRWSPLRQKSMKQKLLKMVDLRNKKLSQKQFIKIRILRFLKKKIHLPYKIPTKAFIFFIFCYGFTSSLQPYQPWHCVKPNLF